MNQIETEIWGELRFCKNMEQHVSWAWRIFDVLGSESSWQDQAEHHTSSTWLWPSIRCLTATGAASAMVEYWFLGDVFVHMTCFLAVALKSVRLCWLCSWCFLLTCRFFLGQHVEEYNVIMIYNYIYNIYTLIAAYIYIYIYLSLSQYQCWTLISVGALGKKSGDSLAFSWGPGLGTPGWST